MRLDASRWLVPGMAMALLAGCAIGPDYKRPPVAEPPAFRGQPTAEAGSLADLPWWEVFKDAILKSLITEALASNYDVKIAAARVQEARAQAGERPLRVLPGHRLPRGRAANALQPRCRRSGCPDWDGR